MYDACGWEVVQLEADGGDIPWYGMYGTILVKIHVLRTMTRTEIWAFGMAPVRLSGTACIYTDHCGVVPALRRRKGLCQSYAQRCRPAVSDLETD